MGNRVTDAARDLHASRQSKDGVSLIKTLGLMVQMVQVRRSLAEVVMTLMMVVHLVSSVLRSNMNLHMIWHLKAPYSK